MKKVVCILLVGVLVASFAVTALISDAEAARPCIQTCLAGTWMICCPAGSGWDCYSGGPCEWTPGQW